MVTNNNPLRGRMSSRSTGNTNIANTQKGNGAPPKGNGCFECGALRHFKRDCPKLKNKDGGNRNAQGWVYAVVNAKKRGMHRETWIPMSLRHLNGIEVSRYQLFDLEVYVVKTKKIDFENQFEVSLRTLIQAGELDDVQQVFENRMCPN
ncbi:putative reverse transcriptase domain-containing protein [Tanacetum coccineum]